MVFSFTEEVDEQASVSTSPMLNPKAYSQEAQSDSQLMYTLLSWSRERVLVQLEQLRILLHTQAHLRFMDSSWMRYSSTHKDMS
jgi:hypothetical protein